MWEMSNPLVVEAFDQAAVSYDTIHTGGIHALENRYTRRWLRTQAPPEFDNLLDLGCGTGLVLDLLPTWTKGYYGVDVSAGMLAVLREKHPKAQVALGDMESLVGIPDGVCSFVVSTFMSFSYVASKEDAIENLYRVMEPNATALLMLPTPLYKRRSTHCADVPFHTWTRKQVLQDFSEFEVVDVHGMSGPLSERAKRFRAFVFLWELRALKKVTARAYNLMVTLRKPDNA